MSLFCALTDGILKMSINDDNSKPAPPKATKPSKGRSGEAVVGEKCKESSKVRYLEFFSRYPPH